jgi:hypothetical protein
VLYLLKKTLKHAAFYLRFERLRTGQRQCIIIEYATSVIKGLISFSFSFFETWTLNTTMSSHAVAKLALEKPECQRLLQSVSECLFDVFG